MSDNNLDWKIKESQKIIKHSLRKWKNLAIAFTGGKDSTVLLSLVRDVSPKLPPLMFIDHGMHFEETHEFINMLQEKWNLNIYNEKDPKSFKKMHEEKDLKNKAALSRMFKIKTIDLAIKKHNWEAIFVGIRWDEHPARAKETYFSKRKDHYRIHPILHFTEDDIWEYIQRFNIPYNPLYDKGYRSIGEKDFTRPVKEGSERSGRDQDKEEVMKRLRKLGYF